MPARPANPPPHILAGLHEAAESFLDAKRGGRGLSANTEQAYRRDLEHWGRLLGGAPPCPLCSIEPAEIDLPALRRAQANAVREGVLGPASRSRMLAPLRGVLGHLVDDGVLAADPSRKLEAPRLDERIPRAISDSHLLELLKTLSEPDPSQRQPWPQRDRTIFGILAGGGLRASEVASLRVESWDPAARLLRFVGKGRKERVVPLPAESAEELDAYLRERTARLGTPALTEPLVVRANGGAMSRNVLDYYVRSWFRRARVPEPQGEMCHAFRHTFATGLVANGTPVNEVQELLGHASLNTTSIYLKAVPDRLSQSVQAAPVRQAFRAVPRSTAPPPDASAG